MGSKSREKGMVRPNSFCERKLGQNRKAVYEIGMSVLLKGAEYITEISGCKAALHVTVDVRANEWVSKLEFAVQAS